MYSRVNIDKMEQDYKPNIYFYVTGKINFSKILHFINIKIFPNVSDYELATNANLFMPVPARKGLTNLVISF